MKKLFIILDQMHEAKDHAEVADRIITHIESTFNFRPGWSGFDEIVIEYLSDGWLTEPVDYMIHRYNLREDRARLVVDELRKFSAYVAN